MSLRCPHTGNGDIPLYNHCLPMICIWRYAVPHLKESFKNDSPRYTSNLIWKSSKLEAITMTYCNEIYSLCAVLNYFQCSKCTFNNFCWMIPCPNVLRKGENSPLFFSPCHALFYTIHSCLPWSTALFPKLKYHSSSFFLNLDSLKICETSTPTIPQPIEAPNHFDIPPLFSISIITLFKWGNQNCLHYSRFEYTIICLKILLAILWIPH